MFKNAKYVFSKENRKLLIFVFFGLEIVTIFVFLGLCFGINFLISGFKSIAFMPKKKAIYIFFFIMLQLFAYPYIVNKIIKKKILKSVKAESKMVREGKIESNKGGKLLIDDRKIIAKPKNPLDKPLPFKEQDAKHLKVFEKSYGSTANSNNAGLVIRTVYRSEVKEISQYVINEEHAIVNGTMGSGKTSLILLPTLWSFIEQIKKGKKLSTLIFDPKGEIYNIMLPAIKSARINTFFIDFDSSEVSQSYNYLACVWDDYQTAFKYIEKPLFSKTIASEATLKTYTHSGAKCYFHSKRPCEECFTIISKELEDKKEIKLYFDTVDKTTNFEDLRYFSNEKDMKDFIKLQYSNYMGSCKSKLEELYLTLVPDNMSSSTGVYFTASPRQWLVAFSLLLLELNKSSMGKAVTKEQFNLATIYKILQSPKKAIDWMRSYKNSVNSEHSSAVEVLDILERVSDDNQGTFLMEISVRLKTFGENTVKNITSRHDIDLENAFKKSTMIFVKMDPEKIKTKGLLVSLLINQIYGQQSRYVAKKTALGKESKLDVTFFYLLDEFANLPAIPELSSKLSFCRSRDIFWYMFIQNMSQIPETYNEIQSKNIISQAKTKVFLMGDEATVAFFSNAAGKKKVLKTSVNMEKHEAGSTSEDLEPLITENELKVKPFTTALIIHQAKPPAFTAMTPFWMFGKLKNKSGKSFFESTVFDQEKVKPFFWDENGYFELFEYDVNKFNLKLLDRTIYEDEEKILDAKEFFLDKSITVSAMALASIGEKGNELTKKQISLTKNSKTLLNEILSNDIDPVERDEKLKELNKNFDNIEDISKRLRELLDIKNEREFTKAERKEFLQVQSKFFKNTSRQ